jgi:hypothetical protein
MACVLRISGYGQALAQRLLKSGLVRERKMYAATARRRRTKDRDASQRTWNICVSERDFDDFAGQIKEAGEFLRRHADRLKKVGADPAVVGMTLDFGVANAIDGKDVIAMFLRFPAELVARAGAAGVDLEVSIYPVRPRARQLGNRARQSTTDGRKTSPRRSSRAARD